MNQLQAVLFAALFIPLAACSQVEPDEPNTLATTATNLVENGRFNGTDGWSSYFASPLTGSLSTEDGAGKLGVQNSGDFWKAQLYQSVDVQEGATYTLSFKARATGDRPLQVALRDASDYEDTWDASLDLTTSAQTFSYTLSAAAMSQPQLIFYAGESNKDVYIDDVTLSVSETPDGGSASRPPYNTSSGFFTLNGELYDANGNAFLPRGINNGHVWFDDNGDGVDEAYDSLDNIAEFGFNAVRIVWRTEFIGGPTDDAKLEKIIARAVQLGMVPVVELHDFTGSSDLGDLDTAASWWIARKDTWAKYEEQLLINIANEFGDANMNRSDFKTKYQQIIGDIRDAGIANTLVVDPFSYGQDYTLIVDYGQDIYDADPQKNVVFSPHIYCEYGQSADTVGKLFDDLEATGLPYMIGEFSHAFDNASICTDLDEGAVLANADELSVGHFGWAWGPWSDGLETTTTWEASSRDQLTSWGETLIYGPNGVRKSSEKATIF